MTSTLRLHSAEALTQLAGVSVNWDLGIIVERLGAELRFATTAFGGSQTPHSRVQDTIGYLTYLSRLVEGGPDEARVLFQAADNPVPVGSVSWEAQRGWREVSLVPDVCFFQARGYSDFMPLVPAWHERADLVVWRGSTTGGDSALTSANLDRLARYRVAVRCLELGRHADVGFNAVVQTVNPHERAIIEARLQAENLLRPFIPIEVMSRARYILDVDGNSNSWYLFQRLRLGACMLKVESDWQQWCYPRLLAWTHYVPVRRDLSDLLEKIDWCRSHQSEAEAIGHSGRALAMRTDFREEMRHAAQLTYGAAMS